MIYTYTQIDKYIHSHINTHARCQDYYSTISSLRALLRRRSRTYEAVPDGISRNVLRYGNCSGRRFSSLSSRTLLSWHISQFEPLHCAWGACKTSIAVCCSVLQWVAVCCSVLQCVVVCCWCVAMCRSVLRCVAVCCGVLQSIAVCCSVLQCGAVWCSVVQCVAPLLHCAAVCCSVLQCAAVCSSVLQFMQYVAMCCNVLQCVAVRCNMQCVTVCRSVSQCVAVCRSVLQDCNVQNKSKGANARKYSRRNPTRVCFSNLKICVFYCR